MNASFRDDLLQRTFVSEDGSLQFHVERIDGALSATVRRSRGGDCLLRGAETRFVRHTDPSSGSTAERLDHLDVELELPQVGPFYRLFFARRIRPGERHDKEWLTVTEDTPVDEIRVFPEYCSSPFVSDHDWQDGWWYPYSSFRLRAP